MRSSHRLATLVSESHRLNLVLIAAVVVYALVRALLEDGLDLATGSTAPQVGDLLGFAALCGLAAFATIEVVKRLASVRGRFQYESTRLWLAQRGDTKGKEQGEAERNEETGEAGDEDSAFDQLLRAIGVSRERGDVSRLFDLPTEQLAAQIGAAADAAISSRDSYRDLVRALAGPSLDAPPHNDNQSDDRGLRLAQRVRVGVDQLQISLGEAWRRFVQGAALWVAGAYGISFAYAGDIGAASHGRFVLVALILGGVFAWIARDLSRVVENARR